MTKEGKAETRQTQGRDKTGFFSSDIARRIAGSLEKQETTARYCKLLVEELNSTLFSTWYMIKVPLHKSSHQQNQDNLYNANPTSAVVLVWESALQVKSMFYRKCFRKDFQEQKNICNICRNWSQLVTAVVLESGKTTSSAAQGGGGSFRIGNL